MKKFLFIVISVVMLMACNHNLKKITGTVKEFKPSMTGALMPDNPSITFSDGRIIYLKYMPSITISTGDEISVWYTGSNGSFIFNDSVTIIKPASLVTELIKESDLFPEDTTCLPLSPGEFDLLVKLVTTQGKKVTASDCQYTYQDKSGNRHALISIRRTKHRADPQAPVSQISVWVNGKNSPEDKIFFSYIIKPDGVSWFDDADPQAIKETVNSLLTIAKKH